MFYTLFILNHGYKGEFGVDRCICLTLANAYSDGQDCSTHPNVYGYVITQHEGDDWKIVTEVVYGVDYAITCSDKGRVDIVERHPA
jgi:hypothetical protein